MRNKRNEVGKREKWSLTEQGVSREKGRRKMKSDGGTEGGLGITVKALRPEESRRGRRGRGRNGSSRKLKDGA